MPGPKPEHATQADIIKLQMDYFFARPDAIVQALMASDKHAAKSILKECANRKIDLGPAIERYFRKWGWLFGKSPVKASAGAVRVPMQVKP